MKITWKMYLFGVLVLINIISIIGISVLMVDKKSKESDARVQTIIHSKTKQMTFDQLSSFFKELAQKNGAVYAFDILKQVEVGPNIDMHLLGHIIGDELYKQKGVDGIKYCTQDFRNACSHTIVIGAFSKSGEKALPEISATCEKAPGGPGAYTMCFHGLGHGVLAYYGFDYQKAMKSCEKTGTTLHHNREFSECVGGMIMELISGGGHNHDLWAKKRPEYLKPTDPLSICSEQNTPKQARDMCYTYITPYLWEAVRGDTQNPTNNELKEAFHLCDSVEESRYREICYGGFGKEFIAFATSRDIRQVSALSPSQVKVIHNLCDLAPNDEALKGCVQQAVASLFWGGENDPHSSLLFCNEYAGSAYEKYCYNEYIQNVRAYISPDETLNDCNLLPAIYREDCTK